MVPSLAFLDYFISNSFNKYLCNAFYVTDTHILKTIHNLGFEQHFLGCSVYLEP